MSNKSLLLSVCLLISSFACAMTEIKKPSLMASARLGNVKLYHHNSQFIVERDGVRKAIQPCWVDQSIRKANLQKYLKHGYLQLKELKNQNGSIDYKLDAYGRLNGEGPVLGAIVAVGGTVLTGVVTAGVAIASLPVAGPVGAGATAYATAVTGMALTVKATVAVGLTPAP